MTISHFHPFANQNNGGSCASEHPPCQPCRDAHVACDRQRPCGRCLRVDKASMCVDAVRKRPGNSRRESGDLAFVKNPFLALHRNNPSHEVPLGEHAPCARCRQAHVSCDRQRPCSRCVRLSCDCAELHGSSSSSSVAQSSNSNNFYQGFSAAPLPTSRSTASLDTAMDMVDEEPSPYFAPVHFPPVAFQKMMMSRPHMYHPQQQQQQHYPHHQPYPYGPMQMPAQAMYDTRTAEMESMDLYANPGSSFQQEPLGLFSHPQLVLDGYELVQDDVPSYDDEKLDAVVGEKAIPQPQATTKDRPRKECRDVECQTDSDETLAKTLLPTSLYIPDELYSTLMAI